MFDASGREAYPFQGARDGVDMKKRIISLLLIIATVFGGTVFALPKVNAEANGVTDVSEDDWFYPYVTEVYEAGIMEGINAREFAPEKFMTRAELVTAFYRLKGSPAVEADAPFEDLSADWYVDSVNWAYDVGIIKGKDEDTFDPDGLITREEICTILERSTILVGSGYTGYMHDLSMFADNEEVAGWAREGVYWAAFNNIVTGINQLYNGTYGTCLAPHKNLTRAEAATMLVRYLENALETESECTVIANGIELGKYPMITAPHLKENLIPLVAMLEAFDAEINWIDDNFAEITVGEYEYVLNVEKHYLQYKADYDENHLEYVDTIFFVVGGRSKRVFRALEKELLVNMPSLLGILRDLGVEKWYDGDTVYFAYRES